MRLFTVISVFVNVLYYNWMGVCAAEDILTCQVGKAQVLLIHSVRVSQGAMTVSQHSQYQEAETETAKWNVEIQQMCWLGAEC